MQNNPDLNPKILFTVGTEVEVTGDSDGFRNSWYLAKIIEPQNPTKSNEHYWIEYENLVEEDDHSQLLKEQVHASLIRPFPPDNVYKPNESLYEVNEVVEALHDDGWWVGVVKEIREKTKYLVSFASQDEIFFRKRKLRIHLDWIDGNWIHPRTRVIVRDNNISASTKKKKLGTSSEISIRDQCLDLPKEGYTTTHEANGNEKGSNNANISNIYKTRGMPSKEDLQSVSLMKEVAGNESTQNNNKDKGASEPVMQCIDFSEAGENEVPQNETTTEPEGANGDEPHVIVDPPDLSIPVSTSEENWPFSKTSMMWKTIDELDIFKNMSIMPHFSPLQKYDYKIRENLAIDMMIKFAFESERILQLPSNELNDSNTLDEMLDSLKDLQIHGFDTMALQDHLKLSPEVHKERELREKLEKVETKIKKCQEEKAAAEIELIQFVEHIKSVKKIKDEELARLNVEKCVISNELSSLQLNVPKGI